jgi:hypothetical protein
MNAMLDAEADRLCGADRYQRSGARKDTRAGHYERGLQTKAGEVKLKMPKLRQQTFETAIIERYRRRESSVEEALIEMVRPPARHQFERQAERPVFQSGGSKTSPKPCGARRCPPRQCRTSTRRSMLRLRPGRTPGGKAQNYPTGVYHSEWRVELGEAWRCSVLVRKHRLIRRNAPVDA